MSGRNEQYAQLASELLSLAKQNDSTGDVSDLLIRCKSFLENLEDRPAGAGAGANANGGTSEPTPVPPPPRPPANTNAASSQRAPLFGSVPDPARKPFVPAPANPQSANANSGGDDDSRLKRILMDLAQDPQAMNAYLSGSQPQPKPRPPAATVQSMLEGIVNKRMHPGERGSNMEGQYPGEMGSQRGMGGGMMHSRPDMMGGGGGPSSLMNLEPGPLARSMGYRAPPAPGPGAMAYGGGGYGGGGLPPHLAPRPRPSPYGDPGAGYPPQGGMMYDQGAPPYGGGGGYPGGGGGGGYNQMGGYGGGGDGGYGGGGDGGYGRGDGGYGRGDGGYGRGPPPRRGAFGGGGGRGPPRGGKPDRKVQSVKDQKGFMWYVGPRCSLIEFEDRYGEARYAFAENQYFKGNGDGPERGQYIIFSGEPNFREVKNNKWRFEVNSEWDATKFYPDPDKVDENASGDRSSGGKGDAPGPMRKDRGGRRGAPYKK